MRDVRNNTAKDWVRLAAKLSLLFTEPKVRSAVGDRLKNRMDDLTGTVSGKYDEVTETVGRKYEDLMGRVEAAADAFQGRRSWSSRVTGLLLGVGIGAGLGILLAPTSGTEMREAVRDKAAEMKDKLRGSLSKMPATGTEG